MVMDPQASATNFAVPLISLKHFSIFWLIVLQASSFSMGVATEVVGGGTGHHRNLKGHLWCHTCQSENSVGIWLMILNKCKTFQQKEIIVVINNS